MAEYISYYFSLDLADWTFYLSDILEIIGMGIWGRADSLAKEYSKISVLVTNL